MRVWRLRSAPGSRLRRRSGGEMSEKPGKRDIESSAFTATSVLHAAILGAIIGPSLVEPVTAIREVTYFVLFMGFGSAYFGYFSLGFPKLISKRLNKALRIGSLLISGIFTTYFGHALTGNGLIIFVTLVSWLWCYYRFVIAYSIFEEL